MYKSLLAYYQAHGKFYTFVNGLEGAAVAALVSWDGGFPVGKVGWITFAAFVGKALWGYAKAYAQKNQLTQGA